jgi:hypothetical protein
VEELPAPVVAAGYELAVQPLARGGRQDWHITNDVGEHPGLEAPDIIAMFRKFFERMDTETTLREGDPVATGQALAKMDTLLADMRYVRDRLRDVTATAMNDHRIRRITVEHIATWESSSTVSRTNWQHDQLVNDMMAHECGDDYQILTSDGELLPASVLSEVISALYSPATAPRVTPIKEAGFKPDDYCDIQLDEDGKPVRTPTVRINDNTYRRNK